MTGASNMRGRTSSACSRSGSPDAPGLGLATLDEYLAAGGYGAALRDDHLYPMAAAIWSTPAAEIGRYPAAAFIRFCDNHALLRLTGRPIWRTVDGGRREYVAPLIRSFAERIAVGRAVRHVRRVAGGVEIGGDAGRIGIFDHAVIATH